MDKNWPQYGTVSLTMTKADDENGRYCRQYTGRDNSSSSYKLRPVCRQNNAPMLNNNTVDKSSVAEAVCHSVVTKTKWLKENRQQT